MIKKIIIFLIISVNLLAGDNYIKKYNIKDKKVIEKIEKTEIDGIDLKITPNNEIVFFDCDNDGWFVLKNKNKIRMEFPINSFTCSEENNIIYYCDSDGIWKLNFNDSKKEIMIKPKKGDGFYYTTMIYNNRNKQLLVIPDSGTIIQYSIFNKKKVNSVKNPYGSITDICLSSDGKYLITSDRSGHVYMRDANTLKIVKTFFHNSNRANALSVAISPDGKYIASGGTIDKIIKIWDVKTGKLLKDLKGHTSVIYSLQFSPDSTKLLSASGKCDELNLTDDKIKLWDVSTGKVITEIKGDKETAYRAIFTPDGNNIITWDGGLKSIEDFGD